eukprot:354865-Chlamydomonas_euryale.AAC.6
MSASFAQRLPSDAALRTSGVSDGGVAASPSLGAASSGDAPLVAASSSSMAGGLGLEAALAEEASESQLPPARPSWLGTDDFSRAVLLGDAAKVTRLLRQNIALLLKKKWGDGYTAWHVAAHHGFVDVLKAMADAGAWTRRGGRRSLPLPAVASTTAACLHWLAWRNEFAARRDEGTGRSKRRSGLKIREKASPPWGHVRALAVG